MTKLTEHTVLARTRAQDLRSVRKLNAWGSELTDVSIVKKLPNVEVLSLSVNAISSLEDFALCNNLQELYIRKNNITELGEIRHLKDLPKLKNLWLADNPCAESDDYRLTVIRVLPQLQKLDNMPVRPDEIESAKKHGFTLESLLPEEEVEICPVSSQVIIQSSGSFEETSVTHTESFSVESKAFSPVMLNNGTDSFHMVKNAVKPTEIVNHMSQSSFQERFTHDPVYSERDENLHQNHVYSAETSPVPANSHFGANFQESCDRDFMQEQEPFPETPTGMAPREHFSPKCAYPPPYMPRPAQRCERPNAIRMLPKGGKSRSANILSAVLCLIKELDWASLEVVDTAIHCQMEELEEQHSSS